MHPTYFLKHSSRRYNPRKTNETCRRPSDDQYVNDFIVWSYPSMVNRYPFTPQPYNHQTIIFMRQFSIEPFLRNVRKYVYS